MPFNYSLLSRERQRLYKLGLFTDVDLRVLGRYDDKKDVLFRVREANRGAVELSLGYGEYELYRGVARSELPEPHGDEQAGLAAA
jgi:outer membrane protein assembly factor BamA